MVTTRTDTHPTIVQRLLTGRPSVHFGAARHWASSLEKTLHAIQAAVRPGDVTIETGVGASTVVFAASGASQTAISPDPQEQSPHMRPFNHPIMAHGHGPASAVILETRGRRAG